MWAAVACGTAKVLVGTRSVHLSWQHRSGIEQQQRGRRKQHMDQDYGHGQRDRAQQHAAEHARQRQRGQEENDAEGVEASR